MRITLFYGEQKIDIIDMVESGCIIKIMGTGRKGEPKEIELEAVALNSTEKGSTEIDLKRVKKPGPIRLPDDFPQF